MSYSVPISTTSTRTVSQPTRLLSNVNCARSFFVAEHPRIHVSGVLAVVAVGFFMAAEGKSIGSPRVIFS